MSADIQSKERREEKWCKVCIKRFPLPISRVEQFNEIIMKEILSLACFLQALLHGWVSAKFSIFRRRLCQIIFFSA